MDSNRAGFIARWFARLARPARRQPGSPGGSIADSASAGAAGAAVTGPPGTAAQQAAAGHPAPADPPAPADQPEPAANVPATDAEPDTLPGPDAESQSQDESGATSEGSTPEEAPRVPSAAPAPETRPAPATRDHQVITVVSLVEHAGATTVAAALEHRSEGRGWRIRAAGPGLARAAYAGMLGDSDALVLVSPADPALTSVLGERLRWLEANNRPELPARTVFVINLGTSAGAELQLPADLDRPVALLPFDPALSIPAAPPRAPRRAARRALDQLVDQLSTILQEN